MGSKHLDDIPLKHKIVIANDRYRVQAALPDGFSIGAGGEVTTPFSGFASEGTAASILNLYTGASQKTGLLTKRLWMGPDQPDISLTLHFEAYYSAFEEVLAPVYGLLLMGTGNKEKLLDKSKELKESVLNVLGVVLSDSNAKKLVDLISFIRAPSNVRILVGDYMRITDVIIGNVNATFSNILDAAGNPMSAEVSLSLLPAEPFTQSTIDSIFSNSRKFKL